MIDVIPALVVVVTAMISPMPALQVLNFVKRLSHYPLLRLLLLQAPPAQWGLHHENLSLIPSRLLLSQIPTVPPCRMRTRIFLLCDLHLSHQSMIISSVLTVV